MSLPPDADRAGWFTFGRALTVALAVALAAVAGLLLGQLAARPGSRPGPLPEPRVIADGVHFFQLTDPSLVSPPGPTAVHLVRLDPARVQLSTALATDEVAGLETVPSLAARLGATVAVNGGIFLPTGDPAGILKVAGQLVSDSRLTRGAVAIGEGPGGSAVLSFDRVAVSVSLAFRDAEQEHVVPIRGVDTTRLIGHLMLYTPGYHEHTDTAPTGTEWTLRGSPPLVTARRERAGRTPIPPDGLVLSFGGTSLPEPLSRLRPGMRVAIREVFEPQGSSPDVWARARHIVGGAGLLIRGGEVVRDWSAERLGRGFETERHPRTVIGRDGSGAIWLAAVDGRDPDWSVGMTFVELQALAARLELVDALNLDGGGSTTMVIGGQVVNRPSDPTGPRKVSDALLARALDPD